MYKRWLMTTLMFGLLCGGSTVIGNTTQAAEKGKTAKAALKQATEAAKKWHGDAVLVQIRSDAAAADGTAVAKRKSLSFSGWVYEFHSPQARKWYRIEADATGLKTLETPHAVRDPVKGTFIDSDQAMKHLSQAGLKPTERNRLRLYYYGYVKSRAGLYWCATNKDHERPVCVDAKTGKKM